MSETNFEQCKDDRVGSEKISEHNADMAAIIYENSERWAKSQDPLLTIEDKIHGAVWHALMVRDQEDAEAAMVLPDEQVTTQFKAYGEIRDSKRMDNFNTIMQNYYCLFFS